MSKYSKLEKLNCASWNGSTEGLIQDVLNNGKSIYLVEVSASDKKKIIQFVEKYFESSGIRYRIRTMNRGWLVLLLMLYWPLGISLLAWFTLHNIFTWGCEYVIVEEMKGDNIVLEHVDRKIFGGR